MRSAITIKKMVLPRRSPFDRLRTGIRNAEEDFKLGEGKVSIKAIKALTQIDAKRPFEGRTAELSSNA